VPNNYTFRWVIAGLALLIGGCEVIVPKQFDVSEQSALQKFGEMPLQKVILDSQHKLEKAKSDQIYFYSPNNFQTAVTSLQVVRAYAREQDKRTTVLINAYRLHLALDEGYAVKKIVQRELDDAIQLRNALDDLQAIKTHRTEYLNQINSLLRLVEQIEKNKEKMFDTPKARANFQEWKKEVMQNLQAFRSKIVRFNYLSQGDTLMADAEEYGAKSIAPITYNETIRQRDSAVDYINNNITNYQGITKVGKQYYNTAKRLMLITQEVNSMSLQSTDSREQYVLHIEQLFSRLANTLKLGDISNESFSIQIDKLSQAAVNIINDNEQSTASENTTPVDSTDKSNNAVKKSSEKKMSHVKELKSEPGSQFPTIKGIPNYSMDKINAIEMKKSIQLLTDQIFQLSAEKNEWTSERLNLLEKIKNLQHKIEVLKKSKSAN